MIFISFVLMGFFIEFVTFCAAAKSLQSCPTLCDPIDGSPPGSRVPGILQARTLEWVAISFSNAWKWKVKVKSFSRVWLFATPWTAAYQAPSSMGFSRQEYWSGLPFPSPYLQFFLFNSCLSTIVCKFYEASNIAGLVHLCTHLVNIYYVSNNYCLLNECINDQHKNNKMVTHIIYLITFRNSSTWKNDIIIILGELYKKVGDPLRVGIIVFCFESSILTGTVFCK